MPRGTTITGHCAERRSAAAEAADQHGVQRAVAARAHDQQVELRAAGGQAARGRRRSSAVRAPSTSAGRFGDDRVEALLDVALDVLAQRGDARGAPSAPAS